MIKNRGDSYGRKCTFTDEDGAPLIPDSQEVTIYDPGGNLKATLIYPTDITLVSGTTYKFYYNIPADATFGDWKGYWKAIKGTKQETEAFIFTVEAKPGES